jgi:hypothetical protein
VLSSVCLYDIPAPRGFLLPSAETSRAFLAHQAALQLLFPSEMSLCAGLPWSCLVIRVGEVSTRSNYSTPGAGKRWDGEMQRPWGGT